MVLLHHLYDYIQHSFTTPKIYDNVTKEKSYEKINEVLQKPMELPPEPPKEDELTSYLKQFQPT